MPTYRCLRPEERAEYATAIEAETPEAAATAFAERNDRRRCEYPDEQEVVVVSPDGSWVTLTVCAASVREYWVPRKRR